jgi:hypothetical protein
MPRPRSKVARVFFCSLACVLICVVFASELPEQLTLTNETSNDYALRPSICLKTIQTLSSLKQNSSFFIATARPFSSLRSLSSVPRAASLQTESLFILHSVLRT